MTASDQDPNESPPTAEEVGASAKETRQQEIKAHEAYMRRLWAGICAGCGLGMMNFPRTGLAIAAIATLPVIIRECKDCIARNRERDSRGER